MISLRESWPVRLRLEREIGLPLQFDWIRMKPAQLLCLPAEEEGPPALPRQRHRHQGDVILSVGNGRDGKKDNAKCDTNAYFSYDAHHKPLDSQNRAASAMPIFLAPIRARSATMSLSRWDKLLCAHCFEGVDRWYFTPISRG